MRLARITTYKKSSVSKEPTQSMLFGFLLLGPACGNGFFSGVLPLLRRHVLGPRLSALLAALYEEVPIQFFRGHVGKHVTTYLGGTQ